jgi:hypothetical protein
MYAKSSRLDLHSPDTSAIEKSSRPEDAKIQLQGPAGLETEHIPGPCRVGYPYVFADTLHLHGFYQQKMKLESAEVDEFEKGSPQGTAATAQLW